MPADMPIAEMPVDQAPARPDRKDIVAFVTDIETEGVVRDGLSDSAPRGIEFHRTNIRGAIEVLQNTATPRVLVVDVTGESRPLTALEGLSDVVEPDVQVLLIGDTAINFYRHATRILDEGICSSPSRATWWRGISGLSFSIGRGGRNPCRAAGW